MRCGLCVACWLLPIDSCFVIFVLSCLLLFVVRHLMCDVECVLFVICCLLFVCSCVVFVVMCCCSVLVRHVLFVAGLLFCVVVRLYICVC